MNTTLVKLLHHVYVLISPGIRLITHDSFWDTVYPVMLELS